MRYGSITEENFHLRSLDGFIRRQEVRRCWRRVDGGWRLLPVAYIEDWDLARRREAARSLLEALRAGGRAYGAWQDGQLAGFALLAGERLGSGGQYAALEEFYVSEPFRRQGIGGELFRLACAGAREMGAEKLYISAHSALEPMAAYRKYGCVEAAEVDPVHAEKEPCDVQLEFRL